jgi:hypothetical protein
MIPIAIIAGAAIVGLVFTWKKVVEWIKRVIDKLSQIIAGVIEGFKPLFARVADGFQQICKVYAKNAITNEWEETVTRKKIAENEVPKELRERVRRAKIGQEIDASKQLLALTT